MTVENASPSSSSSMLDEVDDNNLEAVLIRSNEADFKKVPKAVSCCGETRNSFSSSSSSDGFEDDDDESVELCRRRRRSRSKMSWSLCSIPEDKNVGPTFFVVPRRHAKVDDEDSAYEDDEPIYHRSPVTLENGYRPATTVLQLRIIPNPVDDLATVDDDVDDCGEDDDRDESASEEFSLKLEFTASLPPWRSPSTNPPDFPELQHPDPSRDKFQPPALPFRVIVCLFHAAVGLLVLSVCLVTVLLILLLTFHHFRWDREQLLQFYFCIRVLNLSLGGISCFRIGPDAFYIQNKNGCFLSWMCFAIYLIDCNGLNLGHRAWGLAEA